MTEADKEARKRLQKLTNGDFPEANISIGYEGVQSMELKIRPIKILTQEEADALSPEEQKVRLEELERITSETAHEIVKFLSKSGYRIRRARTILNRALKEVETIADDTIVWEKKHRIDEYGKEITEEFSTAAERGEV